MVILNFLEKRNMAKINTLSIGELIDYERAVKAVSLRYENNIKMYDGSIKTEGEDYQKYNVLNNIHFKILSELENRLLQLS